ncbi:chemotaxis protein CheW [Dictyobacter arantiisoli]|uniref:Chemotaxis protein CheW n=1 Tax=Dictyobacter arantiisoli TaxID=2014874 RepID=A0A5A5TDD1_9CHLR|nr:chemotaxis protein CheW [Dictyobacter arantiisoli]GCF09215.1 chemotaxis protein CheW [Dictyobacter arantiisoli]
MSSEDQKKRDAFAAIQQLISQSPSVAALQLQLAQGQFGVGAPNGEIPPIGEQYLVFALADREFAIKAELVQGVERLVELTPVPNVMSWVKGVMNLRGSIVSVVDSRMFLDLEQVPYTPRTRLLSLQSNDMVICLVVDAVSEMLPISATAINGNVRQASIPSWIVPYSSGSASLNNRTIVILDVARLLFSEKMQRYKA